MEPNKVWSLLAEIAKRDLGNARDAASGSGKQSEIPLLRQAQQHELPHRPAAAALDAGDQLTAPPRSSAAAVVARSRISMSLRSLWASASPTHDLPIGSIEQDQLSVLLPALPSRNNRNNGRHGREGNLRDGRRGSLQDGLRVSGVSVAFVGVSVAFVIGIGRSDAKD